MADGNNRSALFARAIDPDQNLGANRSLRQERRFSALGLKRKGRYRARFDRAGQHRRLPFEQPRIGGGTDLGILAHPRRSRDNLCGEPCEQGHEGKENPVHRPRI